MRNGVIEAGAVLRGLTGAARSRLEGVRDPEGAIRDLLERAGIEIGGTAPHDVVVHDRRLFARIVRDGSLGLGESYVDGWWDSPAVDQMFTRIHRADLPGHIRASWDTAGRLLLYRALNRQSRGRAFEVGERHYDLGNDLYRAMLDRRMVYSCAYWREAVTLDEAQEAKLDLVCRKLGLREGMRVLELGCGWGSFAKFAAERYGVHVTGYSVSREQIELGREMCAGLPVDLRLADYREARGRFDRVLSIGIMEHVGHKNYRTYMRVVDRCLAPGGVALIHTIAGTTSTPAPDPWSRKYIFPNGELPSVAQLARAMEGIFIVDDMHGFGPDYDPTLMAWHRNFTAAWPALRARYGERFYRLWTYYLLMSAAAFRARHIHLVQMVMSRKDTPVPDCRER